MYTALSAVCIAVLLAIVTVCVVIFCRNRRTPWKNIEFIRRFKKGNCAVVYLAAIPLYWIGLFYQDPANWVMAIFTAISKAVTLVVLRYDTKDIEGLMRDNPVYRAAMYLCFVVVAVNAMLFVASLMYQKVWEWWQIRRWNRCKKERLLIVGLNEANLSIYESEKHRRVMLLDDISDGEKAALFAKRINFISGSATEKSGSRRGAEPVSETRLQAYCCDLLRDTLSDPESRRSCVLIINTQSDEANIDLCHRLIACSRRFLEGKDPKTVAHLLSRAQVYVFGSPDHETVYDSIVEASDGCIHYVSKYRRIAMDFIDRYPLTQFMTEEQIDYGTSLLRDGVDVNVAMIGFGKTNRRIFLTSVANNQFMTEENGTPVLKSVRYHIFDKQNAENDKNLNHSYRRFQNEFEDRIAKQGRGGEDQPYLPFPMPASVTSTPGVLDVNSPAFYRSIRTALSGEKSFNYIIIAFGTDLENQDMAQKLLAKKQEWGLRNTYVFVKVQRKRCLRDLQTGRLLPDRRREEDRLQRGSYRQSYRHRHGENARSDLRPGKSYQKQYRQGDGRLRVGRVCSGGLRLVPEKDSEGEGVQRIRLPQPACQAAPDGAGLPSRL